jgi:putative membrane protein
MDAWQWHHGLGGGGLLMGLFWILLILAVVGLAVALLRGRDRDTAPPPATPKETLQARYARGEIDRDEYLEKLRDLER